MKRSLVKSYVKIPVLAFQNMSVKMLTLLMGSVAFLF